MDAWLTDAVAAMAMYGHIKWWDTGLVTNMDELFCDPLYPWCSGGSPPGAMAYFNDDVNHW